jgi:hypothetical protein
MVDVHRIIVIAGRNGHRLITQRPAHAKIQRTALRQVSI